MTGIDYDFSEDRIIEQIKEYIDSTYSTHYAGNYAAKAWNRKGILLEASESNIWKYIERFGMKEGHNPKDLLKIIHYCIFMLYALEDRKSSPEKTFADGEEERIPVEDLKIETVEDLKIETTIAPPGVGVIEQPVYNIESNKERLDRVKRALDLARIKMFADGEEESISIEDLEKTTPPSTENNLSRQTEQSKAEYHETQRRAIARQMMYG